MPFGPEWWVVILIYVGFFAGAALAFIWLGVFVVYVIGYAWSVLNDTRRS
ncbi:MAG: hypothetical protein H0U82_08490 [Actinobacteria bacterium]|nr:hypothetical protein [Actinomycetota bacterium]